MAFCSCDWTNRRVWYSWNWNAEWLVGKLMTFGIKNGEYDTRVIESEGAPGELSKGVKVRFASGFWKQA